jgi:predicted phage terminase large subunit-like protein
MPAGAKMVIGIDPAFSEKTGTDGMGFALTWHVGVYKYVHTMVGFTWSEKDEERFCAYVENMYRKHNVSTINIEANNGGEIIARMLKRRNLSVVVKKATRDKVTRLREYEGCFDRGEVYFLPWTETGVEQLLSFPHGKNDDMVDGMVYSFDKLGWVVFARA